VVASLYNNTNREYLFPSRRIYVLVTVMLWLFCKLSQVQARVRYKQPRTV
jgi:hypothetical protein